MRKALLMATAAIELGATGLVAQGPSAIRLRLEPGSEITIQGTSTLHDFHCKTDKILAYVDVDPSYTKDLTKVAKPLVSVKVNIVARTLTCGGGTIDNNMYKTLKTDEFQLIKYTMSGYDLLDATTSSFSANTKGTLQIAGQDKAIDFKINASRLAEGKATAEGEETIKLTDFGIEPPSFMFGRLKVGNEIKVKFNLKAGPELIAQLKTAINGE
ncbi:MAG TPA: YceI family protein [Gemmatimonadaceae bacterium]|nr:YceI family protein [Gemmatimonadaceae bacterium]